MAVRTHIREGINLLRSASPNVSITTLPGTTPALLFVAGRQLIWAKTQNKRERKTRERQGRAQPLAVFPTIETQKKTLKNFQPAHFTGRRDNLSSFLSYQNKSGMIDEYFLPHPSLPQFISWSLLTCEVIKARGQNQSGVTLGWRGARTSWERRGRPRLYVYSSPARRRDTSFPPSQRLLFREAARLGLRHTHTRWVAAFPTLVWRGRDAHSWRSWCVLSLIVMITSGPDAPLQTANPYAAKAPQAGDYCHRRYSLLMRLDDILMRTKLERCCRCYFCCLVSCWLQAWWTDRL